MARHLLLQSLSRTRTAVAVFDWGGYPYTNARDAVAAAKLLAAS